MPSANPYLQQVHEVLPRLLALYDSNPVSTTYGMGDRYRWAWKLIDFGNGTFQGAAHGLARLLRHGLLPDWLERKAVLRRIDAMFVATAALTRQNGSLEEAFPYESSFCVTALVAFDLLSAIEQLDDTLLPDQRARWVEIVRPMIGFLHRADEHHAFISNHLATAAAALFKWSALTGGHGRERGAEILQRILGSQHAEGWFREYEGADPGYQTLCTYYLADLHRLCPDLKLAEPLTRSLRFLWYFAHPDGSFGGCYGSRNTRFFYPSGVEALADQAPEAASLASFMRASIARASTVTLTVMDEPNLVPMFNAYCWAAELVERRGLTSAVVELPCIGTGAWQHQFPAAGLVIDKSASHYTVISWHKGGVCYRHSVDGGGAMIDTGVVGRSARGELFSTQTYHRDNTVEVGTDTITVSARLSAVGQRLPTPFQFWVLRLLNLTIMRNLAVGNWIKKLLVRLLITGKRTAAGVNRRVIRLGAEFGISDDWQGAAPSLERLAVEQPFSAVHMASQGYWQRQDERG